MDFLKKVSASKEAKILASAVVVVLLIVIVSLSIALHEANKKLGEKTTESFMPGATMRYQEREAFDPDDGAAPNTSQNVRGLSTRYLEIPTSEAEWAPFCVDAKHPDESADPNAWMASGLSKLPVATVDNTESFSDSKLSKTMHGYA